MTGVIATIPRIQFSNALGVPLAGGKLSTYLAGTSTPEPTYQDQDLTIKNPTTITLDGTGSCILWLDPAKSYKFNLRNAIGVTQPGWPVDNLSGASALAVRLQAALEKLGGAAMVGFRPTGSFSAENVQEAIEEIVDNLAQAGGAASIGISTATGDKTVEGAVAIVYPGARKTLADVLDKIQSGTSISIACYGDSLTYGQDTSPGGLPSGNLNGSAITRSRWPYPESLESAMGYAGIARVVYNRGYPGDTAAMGLDRWADADATDVAILMYGTNDGKIRGVSIADYRKSMGKTIEREIKKGAVVILIAPPMVVDAPTNANIQPYTAVLRELAQEYDLQFVDATEQLSGVTQQWTDAVHLTSFAYSELGWHLLALFVNRDRARQSICAGSMVYPTDFLARGGSLYTDARARSGYFLSLAPGEFMTLGGYFDDDVQPVITSFKTGGAIGRLSVLYAGNGEHRGLPVNELAHDPGIAVRQELTANVLRRGYRVLTVTNTGSDACYIDSIEFGDLNMVSLSRGMLQQSIALTGTFQSARHSAALPDWWTAIDYAYKLQAPYRFTARIQQSGTGGLGVYANRQSLSTLSDVLLVLRADTDLIVREIVGGAITTTTYPAIFAAGSFTGEIDVEVTDTELHVYVDGTLAATQAAPTNKFGFPGFISSVTSSAFACSGAQVAGYVKGPY